MSEACKINNARASWVLGSQKLLQVYYKNRLVGVINVDKRTMTKKLEPHDHFFRKFKGWGLSEDVLDLCHLYAIEHVVVISDNSQFKFSIIDFYNGWRYQNPHDLEDWQRIVTIDASAIEEQVEKFKVEPFKPLDKERNNSSNKVI